MKTGAIAFCLFAGAVAALLMGGCNDSKSEASAEKDGLRASFADPEWDGNKIPKGSQCGRYGGTGLSPRFMVKNIPPEADAIVMEYSDKTEPTMDDGAHGKLGYRITRGTRESTIPSVRGHTFSLPEGFFSIEPHQAPNWDAEGAYLPPCSGGMGNRYSVTIKAVRLVSADGRKYNELKKVVLDLGRY